MAVSSSSSLIDLVTHDWKKINLPSLRTELDETLMEFDKTSKENIKARKELSKQTKALKKCTKEEKLKKIGSVLKKYQQHIDAKDAECKSIFDSFLKIYRILSEAPDPIDALQNGQIQILQLQSSLLDYNEIKEKLKEYENEFANLKNQEITVKTLKQQIKKLENEQNSKLGLELMKRENLLNEKFEKEIVEKDAKYNEAKLQLKQLQNEIIHLQQAMDEQQNNLLSQTLSKEQHKDIDESTQTMLEEELDRASITILTLTKERDELLQSNKMKEKMKQKNEEKMIDFEINTLKKRLSHQRDECNDLKNQIDEMKKKNDLLKQTNDENSKKYKESMDKMKIKLDKLPNENEYKMLKDKVSVLQKQFLNDSNVSMNVNASMDALLNTKLQSLQSELTTLRLDYHSKSNQLSQSQNECDELKQQNEEQQALILKLENDLTNYVENGDKKQSISINMSDELDADEEDQYSVMKIPQKVEETNESSAFLIVCEQRDRFRTKAQKLEGKNMRLESKMERLSNDNSTLKDENVSLFQKIKFLENYQSVIKNRGNHQQPFLRHNNERMETEMKYEGLYEESMNPFNEFRENEKKKRIKSLGIMEWIAFEVGSIFLSKRLFRLFGVFYAVAMHLLVFYITTIHEWNHIHCNDEQLPPVQIDLRPE